MKRKFLAGCAALMLAVIARGQTRPAPQAATPSATSPKAAASAPTAASERALLDQYCVTCHSDKIRRANLSLEKLDLTTAGDKPELWEKVIRKLRAGVMPPP